jgi:hypothetical protein
MAVGAALAANGLTLEQFQKSHQEKGEMRQTSFPLCLSPSNPSTKRANGHPDQLKFIVSVKP